MIARPTDWRIVVTNLTRGHPRNRRSASPNRASNRSAFLGSGSALGCGLPGVRKREEAPKERRGEDNIYIYTHDADARESSTEARSAARIFADLDSRFYEIKINNTYDGWRPRRYYWPAFRALRDDDGNKSLRRIQNTLRRGLFFIAKQMHRARRQIHARYLVSSGETRFVPQFATRNGNLSSPRNPRICCRSRDTKSTRW